MAFPPGFYIFIFIMLVKVWRGLIRFRLFRWVYFDEVRQDRFMKKNKMREQRFQKN